MSDDAQDQGRLRFGSPLRVPSTAFSGRHVSGGSAVYGWSSGSSTDTVNFIDMASFALRIPSQAMILMVSLYVVYKHTVDYALVDLNIRLHDTLSSSSSHHGFGPRNVTMNVPAGTFGIIQWTGFFDLSLGALDVKPGQHLLRVQAGLDTAGTLTWYGPGSFASFYYMGTGA